MQKNKARVKRRIEADSRAQKAMLNERVERQRFKGWSGNNKAKKEGGADQGEKENLRTILTNQSADPCHHVHAPDSESHFPLIPEIELAAATQSAFSA